MSDDVTIFHNPACSKSRGVLALLREAGIEPTVIEYLKTPPTREELAALLERMGVSPRAVMRRGEAEYAELGLDDPKWTDAELIGFLAQHPRLIERPIVIAPGGAVVARPQEKIYDVLPALRRGK